MPRDKEPPAFLWYPDDFLSDSVVEDMTTEAVGAYVLLLSRSWREKPPASVPDNDRLLAKWSRLTSGRWQKVKSSVLAAFTLGEKDSRFHQKRLRSEYDKLCRKYAQYADSGRKGAEMRWRRHSDPNGLAIPPPSGAVDVDIETENETKKEKIWKGFCKCLKKTSALRTTAFRTAWLDWDQHRREIRKKLTPGTIKAQASKLEKWGHERAIAAIEHTVEKGWTGLFEPSSRASGGARPAEGGSQGTRARAGEYPEPERPLPILNSARRNRKDEG